MAIPVLEEVRLTNHLVTKSKADVYHAVMEPLDICSETGLPWGKGQRCMFLGPWAEDWKEFEGKREGVIEVQE